MNRIVLAIILTAMPVLRAQDQVQRVFELKYATPTQLAQLLGYNPSRGTDDQRRVWIVTDTKERLDKLEQLVQRFDVPPPPVPNVEVTIYLMSALAQPAPMAVPAELEGVVKQLKGTFSYKGYQLIDTQVIRTRVGQGGESSGVVDTSSSGGPKTVSQVKFSRALLSNDEKGRTIRIDGLKVGLRIPITTKIGTQPPTFTYLDTGISTDIDVHEGQKVVVGKSNMDGTDRASIVVLTAKVVE